MNRSASCSGDLWVRESSPHTSRFMFFCGALGNAAALVLLEVRRRRRARQQRASGSAPPGSNLFQVLLTALLVTDLLGTCSVSPLVITAYSRNQSLRALGGLVEGDAWDAGDPGPGGGGIGAACAYFGVAMTFFSLVTLSLLTCMALERCVSIARPYFYERHVSARRGYLALVLVYAAGALFSLAPLALGFRAHAQYCPGTWCFVDMVSRRPARRAYKNVYATWLLLLIACTVLCNVSVIYHLVLMYRRRGRHRESVRRLRSAGACRRRSLSEELDYLVLLAFMTITFLICSLPLVIQLYLSSSNENRTMDLKALLLLSVNPIIDPLVFMLLSPPMPRLLWGALCKALRSPSRDEKVPSSPSEHSRDTMDLKNISDVS